MALVAVKGEEQVKTGSYAGKATCKGTYIAILIALALEIADAERAAA